VRALIAIGRARDWQAFRDALRDWAVQVSNYAYADASGHVGYQCAGRVPIRGRVARGYRSANEPADQWQGTIPFDGLPTSFEPARGYVASANERVAPDDYPYPLHGSWGSGYRAQRIHQAFSVASSVDRGSAIALQNDVKNVRAERLCPRIVDLLADATDADALLLRDALRAWDYQYTLDTVAPTLFEAFMQAWQSRVLRERFPERLHGLLGGQTGVAARLIERGDVAWFGGDVREEVRAAAADALGRLRTRFGSDQSAWRWGTVHQAHWRHPLSTSERRWLDIGPEPVDGGAETVRNTGVGALDSGLRADGGAEYRLVMDFAEPDHFLAVQNIGNSGRPESPHYRDQFADWLAGRYHVVSLRREAVERDLESALRLERSPRPGAGGAEQLEDRAGIERRSVHNDAKRSQRIGDGVADCRGPA
jgi:penicillin amidase